MQRECKLRHLKTRLAVRTGMSTNPVYDHHARKRPHSKPGYYSSSRRYRVKFAVRLQVTRCCSRFPLEG